MALVVVMVRIRGMVFVAMVVGMAFFANMIMKLTIVVLVIIGLVIMVMGQVRCRMIRTRRFDDATLHAVAIAAAARIAMARTAAVGAILGFLFGLAMGAFVRLDQRLAIGDRNLIIIRMDFAEGQKAVTVAAIFDECRLQ
jgi:hypothetical protein